MHKNFKNVSKCVFGSGSFNQLASILAERLRYKDDYVVFLVDEFFQNKPLMDKLPFNSETDWLKWVDVKEEPKTNQVDLYRDQILAQKQNKLPAAVVGIGGGSAMDVAKAVALMLTNPGSSVEYQGLNLVKNPGIYHVGIPTLAGTGAEVSMTAVLTGPEKKLGLKSDYTVFDQIILDPELIHEAPNPQRFYTGMDCYIHAVEALNGNKNNAFSKAYGIQSLELCRNVFLQMNGSRLELDEQLMTASYFGGLSLTYSEVGVCHALSYGLSFVLGTRHGIANCIVFNQLEKYYPEGYREFQLMLEKNDIQLPKQITENLTDEQVEKMTDIALSLTFMWEHAIGKDWQTHITRPLIKDLYYKMNGVGNLIMA